MKNILKVVVFGSFVALSCFFINKNLRSVLEIDFEPYSRYIAPIFEEVIKALPVIILIKINRLGFMVDCGIAGFGIGTGFAFVENLYYLNILDSSNILLWIVRGFGTAIMHGGITALFGIISINIYNRYSQKIINFIPGLLIAIVLHSIYNHFFVSPEISTIIILFSFPVIIILIFEHSEKLLREWMELGLETDINILESIESGIFSETKYGKYLKSLKDKFSVSIVVDMFCYIQLHTELSIRAKGYLLQKEAGFEPNLDEELKEKINELKFLEKSIGRLGKRAVAPLLHYESKDLWQIYHLDSVN